MKITDALVAEHGVFHGLLDYLEKAAPHYRTLAEIKAAAALFDAALQPHSQVEDDLFIEPLDHCIDQLGQQETFHQEHDAIEKLFRQIRAARSAASARRLLLQAVSACRKHFDKEERLVFPMAEKVLKARTLNQLGTEWLQRRKAVVW